MYKTINLTLNNFQDMPDKILDNFMNKSLIFHKLCGLNAVSPIVVGSIKNYAHLYFSFRLVQDKLHVI